MSKHVSLRCKKKMFLLREKVEIPVPSFCQMLRNFLNVSILCFYLLFLSPSTNVKRLQILAKKRMSTNNARVDQTKDQNILFVMY